MYLRIPNEADKDLATKMYGYCHRHKHKKTIDGYDSLKGFKRYSPLRILLKDMGGTVEKPMPKAFGSTYDHNAGGIVAIIEDTQFPNSYSEVCFVSSAEDILEKGTVIEELEGGEIIVSYGKFYSQVSEMESLDFLSVCGPQNWIKTPSTVTFGVNNKTKAYLNAQVLKNEINGKKYIAIKSSDDGENIINADPAEITLDNIRSGKIILSEETDLRWIVDGDKAMTVDTPLVATPFEDYAVSPLKDFLTTMMGQNNFGFETTEEIKKTINPFTVGKMTLDQQIKKSLKIGVIPFLVGPPGIGKTEIVESQSKHVKTYIMSTWGPASFTGKDYVIPADVKTTIDEKGIQLTHTERALTGKAKPEWLADIEKELELAKEDGEDVILFLDEFDKLTPDLQVFVNGIISNKPTLGGWPIPEGVKIVLAGNTTVDSLASNKISSEVSSRLMTIKVKPNVDEWLRWAINNDIDPIIIAYIKVNRDDLLTVEKGPDGRVDPTISMNPRKWVKMVHKGLVESRVTGEPLMINNYMTEEQVTKFMDFVEQYYNNRIDELLSGTAPLAISEDVGSSVFVLNVVSAIAKVEQLRNILPFIKKKEYRSFFVRNWLEYHPDKKTEVYEIMKEIELSEESVVHGIKI